MSYISFPCCRPFGVENNLGKDLNDTYEVINTRGYSTIAFHCNVPTGGEITFEVTYDGDNWESVSFRSVDLDVYTKKTNNGSDFIGSIAGARRIRFRTSIAGSANGTLKGQIQRDMAILEGIEFGYPPHRFGFTPIHKDATFSTTQTDTPIWTPETGKRFVVTDLQVSCGGVTDSVVTIFDDTNVLGNRLFNASVDVTNNKQFFANIPLKTPYLGASINNSLKLTTSAAIDIDVIMHGYEV
jgi:hypothetical protein